LGNLEQLEKKKNWNNWKKNWKKKMKKNLEKKFGIIEKKNWNN
jgi:hypothetical protein